MMESSHAYGMLTDAEVPSLTDRTRAFRLNDRA